MANGTVIAASPEEAPPPYKPMVDSIASLFDDPKYSDFEIECGDKIWRVHKNIVGSRSDVLDRAFSGQFKEASGNFIALLDDEGCVVREMLRYIYTSDYHDEHYLWPSDEDDENYCYKPMLFNVLMHTTADKYNIPALADLAAAKFKARAVKEWITEDFANAIEEMYDTAPDSKKAMHACAVSTAVEHAQDLYENRLCGRFREVASKTPAFTSAFAARLVSEQGKAKRERVATPMKNVFRSARSPDAW
ncbi:uncharacterized protein RCC_00968 [Ramularia collo-cygni]|uniref:BTB domain-containing protein n=1 Tax=Ramularia collo-cygni TaxID=112498 RepID=A0A2D3UMB3_9PEZI|nr:uncharacterized protein RCC_00968 [Ramularia collo-cygni]CZT15061.1 uncharacterized protein RCC_00968 [Ramularia collo-cygni]